MSRSSQERRRLKAKARAKERARARAAGTARPGPADAPWPTGGGPSSVPPWPGSAPGPAEEVELHILHLRRWDRLLREGPATRAEDAEFEVHALLADPAMTGRVVRRLCEDVDEQVEWAWDHGWEPDDLFRVATRELSADAAVIVRDAVVGSLDRYAAATVAPRWQAQLRAAGASVDWPAASTPLAHRLQGSPARHHVLRAALQALDFLSHLPAIERIEARPGTWVAPRDDDRGREPVDDRLLQRVRQLLAKAESTPYEAEADTFTAAAQSLMARHSIDQAMLSATTPTGAEQPISRRIGIERPYESPKVALLTAVAAANRSRTVWSQHLGAVTVVGFAADIEATEALFTSLLVQATRSMTGYGSRTTRQGASRTRAFRQSFLLAYAARIGQRLQEATDAEVDRAQEETRASGGPSTDLVRIIEARDARVDEAVDAIFPDLTHRSLGKVSDLQGWSAGTAAADRATLFSTAERLTS